MARGLAVALALLVCSSAITHAAALHPAVALATSAAAPRRSLLGFRSPEEESQHKKEREALVTVRPRAPRGARARACGVTCTHSARRTFPGFGDAAHAQARTGA
jgi:hypothetical protein